METVCQVASLKSTASAPGRSPELKRQSESSRVSCRAKELPASRSVERKTRKLRMPQNLAGNFPEGKWNVRAGRPAPVSVSAAAVLP
jgi:hypothetical protein